MKTKQIGSPGAANDKIGSRDINFYYYDFASKGRGEVVRLFFEDAGIAFNDHRWSFEERNSMTDEERAKVNAAGSVPYIEMEGKVLTQSYPMLRYFARKLGEYDGKTDEEEYFADVICDLVIDWRTKFVDSAFVTDEKGLNSSPDKGPLEHYKSYMVPKFSHAVESQLANSPHAQGGPYSLGKNITYADFVLYQMLKDDMNLTQSVQKVLPKCPRLSKLIEAMEARPRLKEYFASDRYYQ